MKVIKHIIYINLLVLSILLASMVLAGCSDYGRDVIQLQKQVRSLQVELGNKVSRQEFNSAVRTLNLRIDALSSNVKQLERVGYYSDKQVDYSKSIDELWSAINRLKFDLQGVRDIDIDNAKKRLYALENKEIALRQHIFDDQHDRIDEKLDKLEYDVEGLAYFLDLDVKAFDARLDRVYEDLVLLNGIDFTGIDSYDSIRVAINDRYKALLKRHVLSKLNHLLDNDWLSYEANRDDLNVLKYLARRLRIRIGWLNEVGYYEETLGTKDRTTHLALLWELLDIINAKIKELSDEEEASD